MKRFYRILFLILTVAIVATAFSIVALATEQDAGAPTSKLGVLKDYDAMADGETIQNSKSKYGKAVAVKQDNGNVYMLLTYEDISASGTQAENVDTDSGKQYLTTYPYAMFSFDIMSPQGVHSEETYFAARLYNAKTSVGYLSDAYVYFSSLGLSETPYDWQHVSIVIEQDSETLNFIMHVFVNGEFVQRMTSSKFSATIGAENYDRSKLTISYTKFNTPRYASQAGKDTAIDNLRATYFEAGATIEEMANYYYNDWVSPYKYTLATLNDQNGNPVYYDDFDKLLADAQDSDVIHLKTDISDVIINESAIVDTNIYDTDGTTVIGNYNFDFMSTQGYVAEENNGIYTITKSTKLINLNWDPACEDDCDCNESYGGHILTATTIAVPGNIPEYPHDAPEFEIRNGLKREFIGWSYENDGTVDELVALTEDDFLNGEVNLYPVYTSTQYSIEYINASGITVSYHFADEYADVVNDAQAGSTIKFHTDVTATTTIVLKKNLTIDLNGFAFNQENIRTVTYNAVQDGSGKWVKDGDAISTEGTPSAAAFSIEFGNKHLTITTSRPGASVHRVYISKTVLVSGEEVVGETVSVSSPTFITYKAAVGHTLNLIGDVTYYAGNLITNDWNNNVNAFTLNIDGATCYQVCSTDSYIRCNEGGDYNFKNSKFYVTDLFNNYTSNPGSRVTNMVIENCDIAGKIRLAINKDNLLVTDSKLFEEVPQTKTTLGNGVSFIEDGLAISQGYVQMNASEDFTLPLLSSATFTYDAETLKPTYTFETVDTVMTTNFTIKKCSEVEGSVRNASLSMLYYTNFNMVLYIPVTEGTDITSVSGFTGGTDKVLIDGVAHYVYLCETSLTNASDILKTTLDYTVGEESYKQMYYFSALTYARAILENPGNEAETAAVANMVRYIKEARLAESLAVSEEFDELIALGNLADLGAKEDYADSAVNYSPLAGYVSSIKFILDSSSAAYAITLTDSAVSAGAVLSVSYVGNDGEIPLIDSTATANTMYTGGTMVYDLTKAIEITVTIPAAEDGAEPTVITGTYSAKAYINATDNTLAKAVYEFGVAAKAYRDYLEAL